MLPRLLIAISDAETRDLYSRFFSSAGYDVSMAADGLQCLERIRAEHPDVLVLDQEIPWGGGDGVLELMDHELKDELLDVVVVTNDRRRCRSERSVLACLEKPCRLSRVLQVIQAGSE